jgi:hypothetical protein
MAIRFLEYARPASRMQRHLGLLVFSGELIADEIPVPLPVEGPFGPVKSDYRYAMFGFLLLCLNDDIFCSLRETKSYKELIAGREGASHTVTN